MEGLVHVTSLENDYYEFDAPMHQLVGARSGKVYQLAAPLRVRVVDVDMEQRRIDFEPVEPKVQSRGKRARGKVPDQRNRRRSAADPAKERGRSGRTATSARRRRPS